MNSLETLDIELTVIFQELCKIACTRYFTGAYLSSVYVTVEQVHFSVWACLVCVKVISLSSFLTGRVVNVSSMVINSALKGCSQELQQKFHSDTITEDELVKLMTKFVEDSKKNVHEKEGWPNTAYGVSKIGVTVLSKIQAQMLNEKRKGDHILLNSCCPGWVRTDMAGPNAPKSPDEGAETPVYLALLPSDADGPHGQYLSDKTVQTW